MFMKSLAKMFGKLGGPLLFILLLVAIAAYKYWQVSREKKEAQRLEKEILGKE